MTDVFWSRPHPAQDSIQGYYKVVDDTFEEMKTHISDANFPKSAEGRVYHLGIKPGELAGRIITVGDPARARTIGRYLDRRATSQVASNAGEVGKDNGRLENQNDTQANAPAPSVFELYSERGFLTITGTYKGTPVSIVSIGMGSANMDFFVREAREVLDEAGVGDMAVIRFGSCGSLVPGLPVGSLTVPKASLCVTRNYDFDFMQEDGSDTARPDFMDAYRISKPVRVDPVLHDLLVATLRDQLPSSITVVDDHLNASADSFYSSQGRITSFPDHNTGLIDHLSACNVGSLEMETFHLLHLAANWPRPQKMSVKTSEEDGQVPEDNENEEDARTLPPPPTSIAVDPFILPSDTPILIQDAEDTILYPSPHRKAAPTPSRRQKQIRAAAVQMIFAERNSRAFITPQEVEVLQEMTSKALLETLIRWKDIK